MCFDWDFVEDKPHFILQRKNDICLPLSISISMSNLYLYHLYLYLCLYLYHLSISDLKEKLLSPHCTMEKKKISEMHYVLFDFLFLFFIMSNNMQVCWEMPGIAVKLCQTYAKLFFLPLFLLWPHLCCGKDPAPHPFLLPSAAHTEEGWHLTLGSRK